MAGNNSVHFIGNVGKAPDFQMTPKGTAKLSFSIAVRKYGKDEKPDWIDVTVYGKQAETLKTMVGSGTGVSVEGRLNTYTFTGKKDGVERKGFEVVASDVFLLPGKKPVPQENTPMDQGEDESVYPF